MESRDEEDQGGSARAEKMLKEQRGGYAGEIIPEATWVGFRFCGENMGKSLKVFQGDIAVGTYFKEE